MKSSIPKPKTGAVLTSMRLGPEEGFVYTRVDGRTTVQEIAETTSFPIDAVERALSKLVHEGAIEWSHAKPLSAQPAQVSSGSKSMPAAAKTSLATPRNVQGAGFHAPARGDTETVLSIPPKGVAERGSADRGNAQRSSSGSTPAATTAAATPSRAPRGRSSGNHPKAVNTQSTTGPAPTAASGGPHGSDTDVELEPERRKRIDDLYPVLPLMDHYQVLGLEREADKGAIRTAYFDLSKQYHPDTLFRKRLGSYKPKMEAIFARITEAYETLGKTKARAEYDASLPPGGPRSGGITPSGAGTSAGAPKAPLVSSAQPAATKTSAGAAAASHAKAESPKGDATKSDAAKSDSAQQRAEPTQPVRPLRPRGRSAHMEKITGITPPQGNSDNEPFRMTRPADGSLKDLLHGKVPAAGPASTGFKVAAHLANPAANPAGSPAAKAQPIATLASEEPPQRTSSPLPSPPSQRASQAGPTPSASQPAKESPAKGPPTKAPPAKGSQPAPTHSKYPERPSRFPEALRGLANSLKNSSSLTGSTFPEPRAASSGDVDTWLIRAEEAIARGNPREALEAYKMASGLAPAREDVQAKLTRMQVQVDTPIVEDLIRKAEKHEEDRLYPAAAALWIRIAAVRPQDATAPARAARNLLRDKDTDLKQVQKYATRALQIDSKNASAQKSLAIFYVRANLKQNARRELQKAIALLPNDTSLPEMLEALGPEEQGP